MNALPDHINLRLVRLRRVLLLIWALVILAGATAEIITYQVLDGEYSYKSWFFSLSHEENLPTWYSSSLLLICAGLMAAIALVERRDKARYQSRWWVLCGLFVFISLDETSTIHEHLTGLFSTRGLLYYDWVIPVGVLVLILGIYFLRFVWAMPPKTRKGCIVSGSIYVGGALGMELPLGWWADNYGSSNLIYGMIDWVEESMELFGISWFLLVLVEFLAPKIEIRAPAGKRDDLPTGS